MIYIKYICYALLSVVADLLAFVLAPVASLPLFIKTDGSGRETIHRMWKWITTHDAPIDLYTHHEDGQSKHWYLKRFTPEQIKQSKWLRYTCRVFWIWRNPAYQFDHWLGYDQKGVTLTKHSQNESKWDTGIPNKAYWTAINGKGQKAFLFEKQSTWGYNFKNIWKKLPDCTFTLEQQYGWKLYRDDSDEVCMLAFRVHPFKKYEKT